MECSCEEKRREEKRREEKRREEKRREEKRREEKRREEKRREEKRREEKRRDLNIKKCDDFRRFYQCLGVHLIKGGNLSSVKIPEIDKHITRAFQAITSWCF